MPRIIFLLLLSLGLSAQPYLLSDTSRVPSSTHYIYLFDAAGTPGIRQDDRLVDSIQVNFAQPIAPHQLGFSIASPLVIGEDLSMEIRIFKIHRPLDPTDDQLLKTLVWQGKESDFVSLQNPAPKQIDLPAERTEIKAQKMRLQLDTLFRK